jgi:energy-coupling factor transport system ATP-binding protein
MTGSLLVDGVDTRSYPPGALAARVGLVFQDPSRQIVMDRVEDDVAFGLENRGWDRETMLARVPEALDDVGLGGLERHVALDLSGGQQQRLALAGVLAPRPTCLVLDEPTANLDPAGTTAFFARLAGIRGSRSATIVTIEHRVEEAWSLADLVLALGLDGTPIAFGTADEVLRERSRLDEAGIWLPGTTTARLSTELGRPAGAAEPIVIEAHDLAFAYDPARPILRGIELTAGAGERVALLGPNGSGKSTLGRLLVGLLSPQAGSVRIGGADPAGLKADALARRAGYVFQEPERQFLAQKVRDEVLLGLPPAAVPAAETLMDRLGMPLERFGDRSPYRLSGGEQRRLSLATVLVRRPAVLVLDEPTFGQDRTGYEALIAILGEHLDAGTCLFVATHDERFVADVATRVIRLEAGRIVGDEAVP